MKRSQNPYLFTKPVTFEEALRKDEKMTTRRRVLDGDFHVLREKQSSFNDLTNFAALCSGKQLRVSIYRCLSVNPMSFFLHTF